MALIDNVKVLLGINDTSKDNLLGVLIEMAQADAVDYCHLDEYDNALDVVVTKMVLQLYNKRGNEGVESVSFAGVGEHYLTDYTGDVITQLQRHRRIVTV